MAAAAAARSIFLIKQCNTQNKNYKINNGNKTETKKLTNWNVSTKLKTFAVLEKPLNPTQQHHQETTTVALSQYDDDDVAVRLVEISIINAFVCVHAINERDAQITLYKIAPNDQYGVYKYAFATSNGINVQAAGSQLEAIGIFSYIAPDGNTIEVRYIADELGFHAVGRHLPRPYPTPHYILRSIEYIRRHPNGENRTGSWKPKK